MPQFIPLSPLGLVVGLATQAVVVAAQAPGAQARATRRDELQAALGGTTDPARAFAEVFTAAFEEKLRRTPSVQIASFGPASEVGALDRASGRLWVTHDVILSQDARMIVARGVVLYGAPGATSYVARHFLVVSEPLPAVGELAAIELWKESGGALLRARGRAVAEELAAVIVDTVFEHDLPDVATLPTVRLAAPGLAFLRGRTSTGEAFTGRLPGQARAPMIRQTPGRATLLMTVQQDPGTWIWVNVPASMVAQPGS